MIYNKNNPSFVGAILYLDGFKLQFMVLKRMANSYALCFATL